MPHDPTKAHLPNMGNCGRGNLPGENGGGGPKTPEARARSLANLDPRAAQKHGLKTWVTRGIAPVCRRCIAKDDCDAYSPEASCRLAEDHQAAIIRDVMALEHVTEEDRPVVVEYAKCAVGMGIADLYLSYAGGPFLPGADKGFVDVQPAMKWRADLSRQLLSYASALGLTPAARAKLKTEDQGRFSALAKALAGLPGAADKTEAIDAEFSAESDTDKE